MIGNHRGDRQLMRLMNTKLVLDAVRAADTISQAQLVRATRLSVGTIVRIVRTLKQRRLVEEVGPGESRVGRKPTQLRFCRRAHYVLAAELTPEETRLHLMDLVGEVVGQSSFAIKPGRDPEYFFRDLQDQTHKLLKQEKISLTKVVGLGLSVPGASDFHTGSLKASRHLGWHDVPLSQELQKALKMPVFVESEARSKLLAEHRWGAGAGANDLLLVEVGTGVGVSALLHGQIRRGRHNLAGELGQNIMLGFGERGLLLEDIASGTAMIEAAREAVRQDRPTLLRQRLKKDMTLRQALRELFVAAGEGDGVAEAIVGRAARALGIAISHQINVLDPDRVLLAGIVIAESGETFVRLVRESAMTGIWESARRGTQINVATLGQRAAILGAAGRVYDMLFDVRGPLLK